MSIVVVKTVSTDNGETRYFRRSTKSNVNHEISRESFDFYLKEALNFQSHTEHGELYTVETYLLIF